MKNDNLFLPVYINKDRLLDINSILFDGYSDFSEMTLESNNDSKKNNKANINGTAGMKIFNLSSDLEDMQIDSESKKEKITLKKVQTTSSLLASTLKILKNKRLIKVGSFSIGDFVEITGIFKNNSICDLLEQFTEMMSFAELASKLSNDKSNELSKTKDQIKQVKQMIKRKDDLERELVYETPNEIYVIHLLTNNIYNSSIDNIYNNKLTYFCQVKNISNSYNFFSDTQLSKFNNTIITDFVSQLKKIVSECNASYHFDFELLSNSNNKTVYELELISIYRKTN